MLEIVNNVVNLLEQALARQPKKNEFPMSGSYTKSHYAW